MHPSEANRRIRDNSWPSILPEWVYTETPSGHEATNMRTGEVWHQWGSDGLYHPTREPHKSSIESIIALICYAAIITAAAVAISIGILMILYPGV